MKLQKIERTETEKDKMFNDLLKSYGITFNETHDKDVRLVVIDDDGNSIDATSFESIFPMIPKSKD
ncbi:MAG: hypothetical protein Q4F95_02340 [Oscillospiraceae bacterium]|nr:hypothetical protein [Oscillospiraceae bacterium]